MNDPITRDLGGNPPQPAPFRRGRNIIAVIGINQYPHNQVLTRAVADAVGVRKLFVETLGFEELVEPLIEQDATYSAITALVTDKLHNALKPDDSLVLFFAGHGHTEKGKAGTKETLTGYLIPYDGRHPDEKKFSTYLKLSSFLEDVTNLPAMHILVIIDACRSGFALSDFANKYRGSPQAYEEVMSNRMSRRVITSATETQDALDNGPLPKNSLFTGALIEALEKGTADGAHLGFVTGSMLGLHLQQVVSTWSGSKQTPDFGSMDLDDRGELVISLRGETQNRLLAKDALEIARRFMTLGYATGDTQRFGAAARQYQHAQELARLGRIDNPEAYLGECRAMVAAGQNEGAIQGLARIIQGAGDNSPDEAFLLLGLAYAGLRNYSLAAANLRNWLERCPGDENAGWAQEYLAWMEAAAGAHQNRISALLIGINEYELSGLPDLNGCVNDIESLIQPVLLEKFQADAKQIRVLKDQFATRRRIMEDLKQLSQRVIETESVLVYFSGHSIPSDEPYTPGWNDKDTYLLLADTTQKKGRYTNGLTALELHQAMLNLRAVNKTLVLDTHTSQALIDLAEANGDYNLILASEIGQTAHEWKMEISGEKIPCGMLSGALYLTLHNAPNLERLTYQQWIIQATQITLAASSSSINAKPQTPRFVGNGDQIVLGGYDPFLKFYLFSQRKGWRGVDPDVLKTNYDHYHKYFKKPFPKAMEAFGNAFLAINDFPRAITAFQHALEQSVTPRPACLSGLAAAHAMAAQYPAAAGYLKEYLSQALPEQQERIQKMLAHLERLAGVKRHVIVYLRETKREELEALPPDLANTYDTNSKGQMHLLGGKLADVLAQKYGKEGFTLQFLPSEVAEAQFLDELSKFAGLSPQQALLVCIFGGSETWTPRGPSSERLMESLRQNLGEAPALIWLQRVPHTRSGTGSGMQETDPFDTTDANIAMLFEVLVQSLQAVTPGVTTATAWRSSVQAGLSKIFAYQQAPDAMMTLPRNGAFFLSTLEQSEFQVMMTSLQQTELLEVANYLSEQVEKHQEGDDYWPEGRLHLGIAHALLTNYPKARQVLEDMVNFLESGGNFSKNVQMAA